jgi:hypothetical protein
MMIALPLILAAATSDIVATQQRVDELVARCDAQRVLRLVAESAGRVTMEPLSQSGEVSAEDDRRFYCVLSGIKTMADLEFGFEGNDVEPNGS